MDTHRIAHRIGDVQHFFMENFNQRVNQYNNLAEISWFFLYKILFMEYH